MAQSNQLLEEEQEAGQKKDRNAKDLNNKIHDLEEELEVGLLVLCSCECVDLDYSVFTFYLADEYTCWSSVSQI